METVSDEVFVIHSKPFSDSRVIIQFFSKNHGRISGIFRLPSKKHTFRPAPFSLLCAHWRKSNKANLKTITLLETISPPLSMYGRAAFCGLYLNELIQRLIKSEESFEALFEMYQATLLHIEQNVDVEMALRSFEFYLLQDLGYETDFYYDISGEEIINSHSVLYRFLPQQGFVLLKQSLSSSTVFSGAQIHGFQNKDFTQKEIKTAAKRFTRMSFKPLLGSKPLVSRSLFQ